MKVSKILFFVLLCFVSSTAISQDITIKKTLMNVDAIASGPTEDGKEVKKGKIYKVYELDKTFYVAIQYAPNDFGMFQASVVTIYEQTNEDK